MIKYSTISGMENKEWWEFIVNGDEEIITSLAGLYDGIEGTETIAPDRVKINIFDFRENAEEISREFSQQFKTGNLSQVKSKNWVQNCDDILAPLTINEITIIPIRSEADKCPTSTKSPLWLIPGMGFGTGHHATTRMITELLQTINITTPSTIIDIGTGSGILSLVAEKLFPNAKILGFDNDEAAIQNALDNQKLNVPSKVQFQIIDASSLNTELKYDLVIANLYAEALVDLGKVISSISKKWLFISGIMESKWNNVEKEFSKYGFTLHTMKCEDAWVAAALFKV